MSLERLLRASFDRHASRIALDDGRCLTYADFGREAIELSEHLRRAGVGRTERVILDRPKGIEGVVGWMAILLSGGVCVPVDPQWPQKRKEQIAEDCTPVVRLGATIEGSGNPCRSTERRSDDLAMILYTSGSTGVPKGVCLSDGNILHFVEWMVREFGIGPQDRLSNHAPYTFDLSLFDHFGAFCAGAAVVPVPREATLFPVQLSKFISEKQVTVWYSVPLPLVGLAERGNLSGTDLSRLRLVLFAGEAFPVGPLRKLVSQLPRVELVNLFGPTETNVCLFHRLRPGDADGPELPIGRPAPGFEIRIEEEELWVRGPGVMQGYWGREPVRDWYNTGDRIRESDGVVWFLGRSDRRVKVRGYRIELGEIEEALRSIPNVREAAVVSVVGSYEQRGLRACMVLERGTVDAVKSALPERLPAYMIPEQLEVLEALPRTSSGKIDYASLG